MVTIQKKTIFFKYFFLLTYIITWLLPLVTFSCNFSNEQEIKKYLQYAQQKEHINSHQKAIIDNLQSALHFISEQKYSNIKIQEYQKTINDFSYITLQLYEEYNNTSNTIINIDKNLSENELKQKLFHIDNQLTDLSEQLKKEYDHVHSINELLILSPQQQVAAQNTLNNLEQRQILYTNANTLIEQAKFTALQSEQAARQLKVAELKLAELSINNRKELSRLRIELLKKKYNYINNEAHILRHQLNDLCQKEKKQSIDYIKKTLTEHNNILPKSIKKQLQINRDLSIILNQQTHRMNNIESSKQEIASCILQVHQTFNKLIEQAQWLDTSSVLKETLRSQISKLPKMPQSRQIDHDMVQLRTKRLQYENQLNKIIPLSSQIKQNNGIPLTAPHKHILETQLTIQRNLITSLLNSFDAQILELTKLKIAHRQLKEALKDVQKAAHRHLFWIADFHPITISYPVNVYQDLYKLLTSDEFNYQIISSLNRIFTIRKTLILIIISCIIISTGLYYAIHHHYQIFLEQSSKKIGKVNQDSFLLTFYNIWYSMLIALPIPILWAFGGYNLNHDCSYPMSVAINDGIKVTTFILWISIVGAYFSSSKGLFIVHFGWNKKRVQQVFSHHYTWSVGTIVFLIMMLTIFNNYNNREFSNTLGRLCFILLCIYLTFITNNLKHSGLPLYLNKYDSSDNIINHGLWNIIICAPVIAAISCTLGYLFIAQELLARLEISLFIWIISLIIYHIIRRWTSIQRRRIAFERAKQKRILQLTLRTHNESNSSQLLQTNKLVSNNEKNSKILDLDTISIQSLQLIRSIITIIALLLMTVLWSELHSSFSFLENITLWDVTSTIKGVDNIQPITLHSFLIAILVIVITTKTVKNLPSFLELTVLQHLDLTPGTGYAITTLIKYILMFLGGIIGCSLIGIEWTKIQWLIAALGVGLGFGLQEIFANLISGLMILFEKPIRIGDTVTINKLTGNITRINTRATIITDWNHKEIIIPNKEFITKQFINWSLSDTLTRVVLRVPAPLQTDMKKIVKVLLQIAKNSSFSLNTPPPEVYLVDLQQGLPMFEIRIHISDIKLRMPLCHQIHMLIIEYYQNNGIKLPYIPNYLYNNQLSINNFDSNYPNTSYYTIT